MSLKSMVLVVVLVLAVCWVGVPCGAAEHSLLVSSCVPGAGMCGSIELVRYRFDDGTLASTETLDRFETAKVRFGIGDNHIVAERYLVTQWGDIYDLEEKTLLNDGDGKLLGVEDGQVVLEGRRHGKRGIVAYDLAGKQLHRLEQSGKWALPDVLAPDGSKSVSVSWWDEGEISLHQLGKPQQTIASGLSAQLDERSSDLGIVPVLWLDSERILTQQANGKLIILALDGAQQPLPAVTIGAPPAISPVLQRAPDGQVLYRIGEGTFLVDISEPSCSALTWMPVGHGFDIEITPRRSHGMRIRHEATVIGEYWCLLSSAAATDGSLAVAYGSVGSSLAYPQGIAVWSVENGQWTEITVEILEKNIGWAR